MKCNLATKIHTWINAIWYQNAKGKGLLLPFSWLYAIVTSLRSFSYKIGLCTSFKQSVPVIVVGNITAGGSGKTPLVIYLVKLLLKNGYKPGVISRGYGVNLKGQIKWVNVDSKSDDVGDESLLIKKSTNVPMVIGVKRAEAAKFLASKTNVDIIISDDGLQHYALKRDIEIIVVDGIRRFGNDLLIPAGPLRENIKRCNDVDFIVNNGQIHDNEYTMNLIPTPILSVKTDEIKILEFNTPITAIAGIGNPKRFFESLTEQGFKIKKYIEFADHHKYTKADFLTIDSDLPILMTAKDAVKCRQIASDNWYYQPVIAKLNIEFETKLLQKLTDLKERLKMGFDKKLLDIVACPKCKSGLEYNNEKQILICNTDKEYYPIDDGIPVLLEDKAKPLDLQN